MRHTALGLGRERSLGQQRGHSHKQKHAGALGPVSPFPSEDLEFAAGEVCPFPVGMEVLVNRGKVLT